MEEPIAMAVEAFGFMSADMLVASYGLLCSGSSSSNNNSNSNGSNSNSGTNNTSNNSNSNNSNNAFMDSMNLQIQATQDKFNPDPVPNAATMTPEERMQSTNVFYENKVYNGGKKIEKKKEKLAEGGLSAYETRQLVFEIKELEIEQAIDQNKLDEANFMIEKNGLLNREEKDRFNAKEKALKEDLKALKESQRSGSSEIKNTTVTTDENTNGSISNEAEEIAEEPGKAEADKIQAILAADSLDVSLYYDFDIKNLSTMSEDDLRRHNTQCNTDTNNK